MIHQRVGHSAMRRTVQQLLNPMWQTVQLQVEDLERTHFMLNEYADAQLDFVDCAITAMAERLNIETILTFDRRDFSIIRPKHAPYFNILPN